MSARSPPAQKAAGGPRLAKPQWKILEILDSESPRPATFLSRRLGITIQATARQLKGLAHQDLIAPDAEWGIRRPILWQLSPRGSAFVAAAASRAPFSVTGGAPTEGARDTDGNEPAERREGAPLSRQARQRNQGR
jgi:DNA-binding MarR family transcriptional regulator